jgi:hypothetical protein
MSVRRALARATTPALAGLAASGLVISGVAGALPSAQAAPAHLHKTGTVAIGAASSSFSFDFSEAPNGAVYYSRGKRVYVVNGTSAPSLRLTASGNVLAVTANSTELFVDIGRTVTAYQRSTGKKLRQWTLRSLEFPTSAALYAVGSTVWAWTDPATDTSGFEFANVDRFTTSSAAVHLVSKSNAYPADMAADSAGLYFERIRANDTNGYLVHVTPAGSAHRVTNVNINAPLALAGGRVELLAVHAYGHTYLDSYGPATLARKSSKRVSGNDRDVAGTGAGLLVLDVPCAAASCPSASVIQASASTGGTVSALTVPGAQALVPGSSAVVVTDKAGKLFLVRLAG